MLASAGANRDGGSSRSRDIRSSRGSSPVEDMDARRVRWQAACRVAVLLAAEPWGLGGVHVRAACGPARDRWLALLQSLMAGGDAAGEPARPLIKIAPEIGDDRLIGGLELAQTLSVGRPVFEPGLLARAHGGLVVLAGAERATAALAARLAGPMDEGACQMQRDGVQVRMPACFGVVAIDEGEADEEGLASALADRLAFSVDLDGLALADLETPAFTAEAIAAVRALYPRVVVPEAVIAAMCTAAAALGVGSVRAVVLATRAARAIAALEGQEATSEAAAIEAVRLVLGPRARQMPTPDAEPPEPEQTEDDSPPPPPPEPPDGDPSPDQVPPHASNDDALYELMVDAVASSLPDGLLDIDSRAPQRQSGADAAGESGIRRANRHRGRQIGVTRGEPRGGARLDILATLRAAAPWQRLRTGPRHGQTIAIRRDDFRVRRYEQPTRALTVFVVDASGSAALHRLAEAKGAVELLLADCYVRRDAVALVTFRGPCSELALPPTRSLARAKRLLGALPGGGGTPLADALVRAQAVASDATRRGFAVTVVLLTDARANVALDRTGGRPQAEADALRMARLFVPSRHRVLLIDTSPRPQPFARTLADALGGRYLALPQTTAQAIATAARAQP